MRADRSNDRPGSLAGDTVILVTGGAGFIGSNFIRHALERADFSGTIINYDKLTYAGNLASLADVDSRFGGSRYRFEQGDVCDPERVESVFARFRIDAVVHFAAESHVDRSIVGPSDFIDTNINGTFRLLEAARKSWKGRGRVRFHHVSTDEVFGSLGAVGQFTEASPYDPRSPYSASKAASDHLVRAYGHTYELPFTISNCSNNYGPFQFPEKLIPLATLNAIEGKTIPVYGTGTNVRDWLFVEDHCEAIWKVLTEGRNAETYAVGGDCERANIEVVRTLCDILSEIRPLSTGAYRDLITFVADRPGHDQRYAIDSAKIKRELGWSPKHDFSQGLRRTVLWYINNTAWVDGVRNGSYRNWIELNYERRKAQ